MRTNSILKNVNGFTLIELLLAMAIVAILAVIANVSYSAIFDDINTKKAIGNIYEIELIIERYNTQNNSLPLTLAGLGAPSEDPWGELYVYLNFDTFPGNGGKRKDRGGLVPVNSDYDLYSKGPDKATNQSFNPPVSQDDIVRANNGGFIGIVKDF